MIRNAAEFADQDSAAPDLRAAIAQLQYIVDMMPAYVARCSRARRFAWINRPYAERFGLTPDEIVGRSIPDVVGEPAYCAVEPYIERVLAGETVEFEVEIVYRGGAPQWMHMTYAPTLDAQGVPDGWIAVVTDISRRKAIEVAQMRQAAELQAIYDTAPVGIILARDPQCTVITANRVMAEMLGMPLGENVSKSRRDADQVPYLVYKNGVPVPAENLPMQRAAALGVEVREEILDIVRGDGSRMTQLINAAPIRDESGAVTGAVGIGADITSLRAAQEALRESEQRFARFMQHLPGLAWIKDLEGRYIYVNDAAEAAFRVSRSALYGKTDAEIFPPDTATQFRENDRRALDSGAGIQAIELLEHTDGMIHRSLVSKFAIPGREGAPALIGGMAIDITERWQAEEALRESERSLREADRHKDEFLATLAHELRNPLAPIASAAELLRLLAPPDPEVQSVRDIIERQTKHLTRLVDDLLDVSRVSRGKVTLRVRKIDIASVVAQAIETNRPLIAAAGHELALALPPEPLVVEADPTRLAQTIGNLLNNAAKFTSAPGWIGVQVAREGALAKIVVRDTGIGIPADMLSQIFDLFAQVETGVDRRHSGLGIGLTLVKDLVQMHGGTVEARSDGPGHGSAFIVRLPLAAVQALPEEPSGPAPHGNRRTAAGCRILVVDDNRDATATLARQLQHLGHDVETAHDGSEALETAAAFQPRVMLVDLGMPGISGYEVARQIRERSDLAATRLVALTGWGQPGDRARTREAGFYHHLVKPVELDLLESLIAQWAESTSHKGTSDAGDSPSVTRSDRPR
jgi:PAS domain S-box-containing protein